MELRVNVRPGRYRVPDVVLIDRSLTREEIITHPPSLCVEVLSPEYRISETDERLADYFQMGVPCVWIFDPVRRKAFLRTGSTSTEVTGTIRMPGTPIELALDDVFAES